MLHYVLFILTLGISYINSTVDRNVVRNIKYNDAESEEDKLIYEDSEIPDKDYDAYIYPNETKNFPGLSGPDSSVNVSHMAVNGTITMQHNNGSTLHLHSENGPLISLNDEKGSIVKLTEIKGSVLTLKHDNGSVINVDQKNNNLLTLNHNGIVPLKLEFSYNCDYCHPEQVHLSFGDKFDTIVITWITFNDTKNSFVKYGTHLLDLSEKGTSKSYHGPKSTFERYIHTVKITKLTHGTTYKYHCGSDYGWSDMFEFRVPDKYQGVVALVFGDMGNRNPHALSYIQSQMGTNHMDLAIHVGDFAYDLETKDGRVGDQFMRQIQPIAANLPYMTCPGNHEKKNGFFEYQKRFMMPTKGSKFYYSFDVGLIHFISINTEVYFNKFFRSADIIAQYFWLDRDLKKAAKKRHKHPWIILFGHRPMYCSNLNGGTRCNINNPLRVGSKKHVSGYGCYGIERLLQKYGVDVAFWGHQHSYERLWPIYDYKVDKGADKNYYKNPKAPVHVTTGSAGCWEKINPFTMEHPEWSAFRSEEYGYMMINVPNKTHMNLVQFSADRKDKPIDKLWIEKTDFRHHLRGYDM